MRATILYKVKKKAKGFLPFYLFTLLPFFASCTDYSDFNTVPSGGDMPGANSTLWENISSDAQLTKFTNLAKKCNFSEALNSPRFYTVWAPVDAAISDAEYNRLMACDSATIVKQFIQQHITEYNYPVSAALENTTIVSLNAKHHAFTHNTFDGFDYAAINLPSTNGVLHKINGLSEYHLNLYESIDNYVGCDSIKKYIQRYDEYYLDKNASVLGPLRDGKQTYLDSVMKKRNNVIADMMCADLEDEDSTFCMLVPNDQAWKSGYIAIKPRYNYIPKIDYLDLTKKSIPAKDDTFKPTTAKADKAAEADSELQDSLICRNLVTNLVFSKSYQRNQPLFSNSSFAATDSAFTTGDRYLTNMQEVLNHTTAINEMSNGMTRTIDSLTFNSWETYNPIIKVSSPVIEKDGKEVLTTLKVKKLTTHNVSVDSLAKRDTLFSKVRKELRDLILPQKSRFFTYIAVDSAGIDGNTSTPEFDFALKGVRSGTYHIYVVTVPAQVEEPEADVKPYYLRFYLSWTDANNKQQYEVLPKGSKKTSKIITANGTSTGTLTYLGDPGKVHGIDLGEFTFQACYYGLDAYPSLMMVHTESYTSSGNRKKYDQQMRVAGVFLIPKEYHDTWLNIDNE